MDEAVYTFLRQYDHLGDIISVSTEGSNGKTGLTSYSGLPVKGGLQALGCLTSSGASQMDRLVTGKLGDRSWSRGPLRPRASGQQPSRSRGYSSNSQVHETETRQMKIFELTEVAGLAKPRPRI
ncbi:hypothetical protein AAFF_G00141770 [Aldrovandia affinis]|uniref:Uncharacterized protein n=1 Tax=Aldrovandia affinis TaxID=143900 RepID=A0AAD7X347_9TELE|nr:hypothetical protein AAFF_G00141770 [Aldrovandia affinis]